MKKLISVMTLFAAVIFLGACGSSSEENQSSGEVQKIKDSGTLKVGLSADFAPFEFHTMVDGKDTIVGADVDLANEIGKELGVDVELMDMEFNAVLAALQQGKVDIAISGISATPERKQSFAFSENYYSPPQRMVINRQDENSLTTIGAFDGQKVGAQKGSVQESIVRDQLPNAQVVSIAKVPNLIIELNQGSIKGLVLEETVAQSYINQNPNLKFAAFDLTTSQDEAYAIAMPKDSGNLKEEIDKVVKRVKDSGQMEEFVKKNTELANQSTTTSETE